MNVLTEILSENKNKKCLICGEPKIKPRAKHKYLLSTCFCKDCYLPGQNKVLCRVCKIPIELSKDYQGNFKTRCFMCHISREHKITTI